MVEPRDVWLLILASMIFATLGTAMINIIIYPHLVIVILSWFGLG